MGPNLDIYGLNCELPWGFSLYRHLISRGWLKEYYKTLWDGSLRGVYAMTKIAPS